MMAAAASYDGIQETAWMQQRQNFSVYRIKSADHTTYTLHFRKTTLEQGGLDQRWEPLARVPIPSQVSGYLPKTDGDGSQIRLLRRDIKNAFCHPFGLSVPGADYYRWIVDEIFKLRTARLGI